MIIKKIVLVMVLSICLLFPITDVRAFVLTGNSINNNYNNPGARANAMGGAFIGLADDATAAYTNPAGLSVLTKPEVAAEFKINTHTTRSYDKAITMNSSDYDSTTYDLSFASFSYPAGKFNITIYRHTRFNSQNNYQAVSNYKPFPFYQNNNEDDNREIVAYGLSAAYKVLPNFSLGASIGFCQSTITHSSVTTYTSGSASTNNMFYDNNAQAQSFSVALLWNPFSTFNIGMVYRYGPSFDTNVTATNVTTTTSSYTFKDKTKYPDVYGVGISYSFPFGLTAAFDFDYIKYSQYLKDNVFYNGTKTLDTYNADEFKVDDNYEIHAGVEYAFNVKETPLAIRGGYCYKRDHRAYYEPNQDTLTSSVSQTITENGLGMGDNGDEHIFSFGFGAVLGKNFQVDLSGSWGTFTKEYITSLVYRF